LKKQTIVLLMIIITAFIFAEDIKLITDNGEVVILHENGTWEKLINNNSMNGFDFRRINWGMDINTVKESEPFEWEKGELDVNTQYLFSHIDLLGEETMLAYYFNLNRVYQTRYMITEKHSNKTEYWQFYKRLISELKNKYGNSASCHTGQPVWLNELNKDNPDDWGTAISTGDMHAVAKWELPETTIIAIIKGNNHDIDLWLEFKAKNINVIETKKTEAF